MLTKENDICVWRTNGNVYHTQRNTHYSSSDDDDTTRRRRRIPLSTHTVSHILIYTHTYRVTDEGNTGHINGKPPQHNRTLPLPYLPPLHHPPLPPTHTQLIYITCDDKCQHSYKDPWLPLPHIVTSFTLYTYAHTPLVRPSLSISPPLSVISK